MKFIDTHCHLNNDDLFADIEGVMERAEAAHVSRMIVVGYSLETSRLAVEISSKYDNVWSVVGIHPHDAETCTPSALDEIKNLANNKKVVSIGEIGLDFYRDLSPRPAQYHTFQVQRELAREWNYPIVIHCRDAYEELLEVLESEPPIPGVLHCFGGTLEQANRALDLGMYLGFDGPVTYKNADSLREVVKNIPIDKILIETDAPYLTPHPFRGKQNEPCYIPLIAEKIAELHNINIEELANIINRNAVKLFSRLV